MVILGLGSNICDRLAYLRQALHALQKIPGIYLRQVSPVYVSDALLTPDAPKDWNQPYLNLAIRLDTQLDPHHLLRLTKDIEVAIGRTSKTHWGPRPIDIDILIWDDLILYDEKLHIPHEHLHTRPFALWPVADLAPHWIYPLKGPWQGKTVAEIAAQWGSRFSGLAPLHTRQIQHRIDTPEWVGILNVTPDSFSDGGQYHHVDAAIAQAKKLSDAGAHIIDIGAEASGPSAIAINAETEWQRLEPILIRLIKERQQWSLAPKISLDTRHFSTAQKALSLGGVDWINDVSGLTHPHMREVIANSTCDVVLMHNLGIPAHPQNHIDHKQDPVSTVYEWLANQILSLEQSGIAKHRIICDIGIGFGKTAEQSLTLLQQIQHLKTLNTRLLVGHSRKSFLSLFTPATAQDRDTETLVTALSLANLGVDYIRVHNIDMCARGIKIAKAMLT